MLLAAPAVAQGGTKPRVLPGGEYEGETKRGKPVLLKATGDGERGVLRLRCARARDRFRIEDDGRFVAKAKRNGRVVLKAKGRFRGLKRAKGRMETVRSKRNRCAPARFRAKLANVELRKRTISYPHHVEPATGHGHGGHNLAMRNVERPCEDCFLVAMVPDLTDAEGRSVNFDGEAMMHHVVFTNRARPDATCENRRERFFASGNERTAGVIPAGYGYRVRPGDSWNTLAHVMNLGDAARTLNIEITFYYAAADSGLSEVRPFWLDVDNCSDSEYSIPAGRSSTIWDFTATAELEGRIVAAAGHLHDDGVRIGLRNRTAGELLCTSRAGFDTEPSYLGHIEAMSACYGDPLARVGEGDVLRITSVYDSPVPQDDVMGIVLGYLAPA